MVLVCTWYRRRGGTFDGVSLAMPLNEAYQTLLDAYMPFLLQEAEVAASFLMLYKEEDAVNASQGVCFRGKRRLGKGYAWVWTHG